MMADRAAWDEALARYQACKVVQAASDAWGPHYQINEGSTVAAIRLNMDERSPRKASKTERERWDVVFSAVIAAEDAAASAIYQPMWQAAAKLVSIPAPDIKALQMKHEVIKEEEVWNCKFAEDLGIDCWAVLIDDARRLTGLEIKTSNIPGLPTEAGAPFRQGGLG